MTHVVLSHWFRVHITLFITKKNLRKVDSFLINLRTSDKNKNDTFPSSMASTLNEFITTQLFVNELEKLWDLITLVQFIILSFLAKGYILIPSTLSSESWFSLRINNRLHDYASSLLMIISQEWWTMTPSCWWCNLHQTVMMTTLSRWRNISSLSQQHLIAVGRNRPDEIANVLKTINMMCGNFS